MDNQTPQFYSKEIMILQQSQSKLALEYLTLMGIKPTVKELWSITEVFVQCCLMKQDKSLKDRITNLDKYIANHKK
jgi:hypothetical protein